MTVKRALFRRESPHRVTALDLAFRALMSMDRRPGLSIILFHRILPQPDPYRPGDPTSVQFEAIASMLARNFVVLPLEEGIERLEGNSLPKAAVAITFDDGYRDNLDIAAPILIAHGLTATFFLATGYLDGSWMFNDRIIESLKQTQCLSLDFPPLGLPTFDLSDERNRIAAAYVLIDKLKYLPFDQRSALARELQELLRVELRGGPMLDGEKVRQLRALGMTIGAHTVSHPILAKIEDGRARAEIGGSRAHLVELLREPVWTFAYPNGLPGRDYRSEHVKMVGDAQFKSAVSTAPVTARPGMNRYELPRFTPWDRNHWRFAARLAITRMLPGRAKRNLPRVATSDRRTTSV